MIDGGQVAAQTGSVPFVPHWVHSLFQWLSWHWGDVLPAWLAVLVTVFFGFQSKAARDGARAAELAAKSEAELATKAAEAAAAAADRSASAAERFATAQEKHVALLQDSAEAAERFPWRINRTGDSMDFRMANLTLTRKYGVTVTGEPARGSELAIFRPGGGGNSFDVVDGRQEVELDLFVAMQMMDRAVTVNWRPTADHTGDLWTQRIGLL